jgi:uncharacterized YccA/Bax inhibitor family protein
MAFRSRNPILNGIESNMERGYARDYVTGETASFTGIATKTGISLAIIVTISALIWRNMYTLGDMLPIMMIGSAIAGFIFVLLAQFTPAKAFFTLLYAVAEGVFLGSISYIAEAYVEAGIVFNAVTITFSIFLFLLIAYSTGLFKVGFRFRKIVYSIMFSLVIFFLFSGVLRLFGLNILGAVSIEFLILLTVGMIILASFNLLIDFDNCKIAVDQGAPKKFEWQLSLGLLVSLVWLYVEVLRLLILLASRAKD